VVIVVCTLLLELSPLPGPKPRGLCNLPAGGHYSGALAGADAALCTLLLELSLLPGPVAERRVVRLCLGPTWRPRLIAGNAVAIWRYKSFISMIVSCLTVLLILDNSCI
jgi:hypothetical protein